MKRYMSALIVALVMMIGMSMALQSCSQPPEGEITVVDDEKNDLTLVNSGGELPIVPDDGEDPVVPDDGEDPVVPDDGEDPVVPDDGEDPVVPDEGEDPIVPDDGEDPVVPDEGDDPIVPDDGEDPIVPNEGEDPVVPDEGEDPIIPDDGEDPVVPDEGDDPIVPDEGEDPIVPNEGEDPVVPDEGEDPIIPDDGEDPVVPDEEEETERNEHKAPIFTIYDEYGNEVSLSDYIGKPIVLNFWATWCPPCRYEMPEFQKMHEELADEVVFLMVNVTYTGETVSGVKAFLEENGYTFTVLYDTYGDASDLYGIEAYPTTYFIDKDGYLIARAVGALSYELLSKGIEMIA